MGEIWRPDSWGVVLCVACWDARRRRWNDYAPDRILSVRAPDGRVPDPVDVGRVRIALVSGRWTHFRPGREGDARHVVFGWAGANRKYRFVANDLAVMCRTEFGAGELRFDRQQIWWSRPASTAAFESVLDGPNGGR